MQLIDGQPVYSATDLVGYLACESLTALERATLAGLVTAPVRRDAQLEVIQRRGLDHERRYLAELVSRGGRVVEIRSDSPDIEYGQRLRQEAAATRAAMSDGADVIYQATFFDGRWVGHADFLLRVNGLDQASCFGPYHYEVADTKLAHHVKASALLQICSYIAQLEQIQGIRPTRMHVVLGGNPRQTETFRVDDFFAYYRMVRARFEAAVHSGTPVYPLPLAPDPVEHCDVCRWADNCDTRRHQDDHLSLVAGISRGQRRELTDRGIVTLEGFARLPLPLVPAPERTSQSALAHSQDQARIQLEGRESGRMLHELLSPIEENKGLAALPPPSPGDLFLDLEGDPYALDNGLDYLFGVLEPSRTLAGGEPFYHAFWSTDGDNFSLSGEKAAFEATIDLIMDRLKADPSLHVYHYASYEPTAFKRLMGRYGTREDEVDHLLRGHVLVDLYRAVRQGLRASVESYSIKRIEPLYGLQRIVPLRDATSSIVEFETWLQLGEGERPAAENLDRILAYNRDDVLSTWRLRDWLEGERALLMAAGTDVPRPTLGDDAPSPELSENLKRTAELARQLTADLPVDPADSDRDQQGRWLLAQLLSWHRREEKSTWWLYFHLMNDLTDDERIEAKEPIGGLEFVELLGETSRGLSICRYQFPAQEHAIEVGSDVHDPRTGRSAGTVVAIDDAPRLVDVRLSKATEEIGHPTSLVPLQRVSSDVLRDSLLRLGEWVAEHGIDGPGAHRAARDLLIRLPPHLTGRGSGPVRVGLRLPHEELLDAARRLVLGLDASVLPVQGPPGAGKTYTGARMIVALLAEGKRVGITANSHKVIGNFLREICKAGIEQGVDIRAIQKAESDDACDDPHVECAKSNEAVADALTSREKNVAAGTAWLWARPEMAGTVDVLFIDEAGQLSLANAVAVAHAARSLVLLGDPQQLNQPLQGVHPPGADASALGHLLCDDATIPPDRGLFLETTWRLAPEVCGFTSEAFYEGKLVSEAHLVQQRLNAPSLDGAGLWLLPVNHSGNDNRSDEEAAHVAMLARELVEGPATWVDDKGREAKIGWNDVLIVAPYNAHVGAIKKLLPPKARVGTVDKFQGQEAPVSIYSMATSSPEDAPRGMTFLYSRHRLNVATSRARCAAILVCSPDLLRVQARTPEQMRLANALCQFVERAKPAPDKATVGSVR